MCTPLSRACHRVRVEPWERPRAAEVNMRDILVYSLLILAMVAANTAGTLLH